MEQLRDLYKCRTRTIGDILRGKGIDTSKFNRIKVNKNMDHNFFEVIDTEEKAYLLGMLMSDGSISRTGSNHTPTVNLELIDLDVIEKLREAVNGDSKITKNVRNRKYIKNENPTYSITLASDKMVNDLKNYGVIRRKTKNIETLKLDIPFELEKHYLRGLFDGDGSIYYSQSTNRWFISFTNHYVKFVEDIQDKIIEHIPSLGTRKIYDGDTVARLTYSGKPTKKVIELLYSKNNISMDRKQELADQAVNDIV